ncbi:MAG: hypothetical protein JNK82_00760, partial [Myxococcaceae bacterium]|nr:hypothetical protein [Myxococcaceae bacterium]
MSEQLANPLEELARAAETFRFEVPRSHRGLPGLGVTAAKNAFLRALKPMHIETLRPQREFNLAALKVLAQISVGAIGPADGGVYIRATLLPAADPGRWSVSSHRQGRVGAAITRAKSSYLQTMQPVVKQLVAQQRRFNELVVQGLVELSAGTLRPDAPLIADLVSSADLFAAPAGAPALRATRPLWNEVFRFQTAFNQQLAQGLKWFSSFRPKESLFLPTVSVVALEAQAGTLPDFLLSIASQGYGAGFEVLVVTSTTELLDVAARKYAWVRAVPSFDDALDQARGDVLVVTDARRTLGAVFLETHAREYLLNERTEAATSPLPNGTSELIDPLTPTSFVNFGTGAFSVRRSRAGALRGATSPLEQGYRLYQAGVRVTHASDARSEGPPAADPVAPFLAAHPEAGWLTESARRRPVARAQKRLRILTYRWHCAHQYELFKLPHDFTLLAGRPQFSREWDFSTRPLRENAKFVPREALDLNDFDLAILPFDESCVNPSL